MSRSRSPIETAIVAWIALHVVSTLLGVGLLVGVDTSHSSGTSINPTVVHVIAFLSWGIIAYLMIMLLAEGHYSWVAGGVVFYVVFFVAFPHAIVSASRKEAANGQASGTARSTPTSDELAIERHYKEEQLAAEIRGFYADLRATSAEYAETAGTVTCAKMTAAGQRQLVGVFATGSDDTCRTAAIRAGRSGALGPEQPRLGEVLGSVSLSSDLRRARYYARNGVRLDLVVPPKSGSWLVDHFAGGPFSSR
jgi:hypothetical protein